MKVTICDNFDLQTIADSGQCFRAKEFRGELFRFITAENVLYIKKISQTSYDVSCSLDEWNSIWFDYFDLGRNYGNLEREIPDNDLFLKKAYAESNGLRILRQDHWETLISFIISQRKTIPSIKKSIELICTAFGTPITTPYETVYSFPSALALKDVTINDLKDFGLGYRDKYILYAIKKVSEGELNLKDMELLSDGKLYDNLRLFYGVGAKVANCVCLFSYGRTSLAPIDTWIKKVIDTYYGGTDPFPSFGENAGIVQQYIFNYTIHNKKDFE